MIDIFHFILFCTTINFSLFFFFFFNDTATTEIYTLSLHDALPISRAEISRRAGISKPTVSLALQSLVGAGLVREALQDPAGPSYGAVFFEPVPDAAFVLGLDLGARFLRGAVCDLAGEIRVRQDVELRGADAEGALEAMVTLHESLVAASGLPPERIDGVVVGVPGVV